MPTYPQTSIEKKAWNFAKEKHEGTFRKFQKSSYFDGHVAKVFGLVKQYDTRSSLGAAALLHDVVEDTDVTYEEIVYEFGLEIANLVKELTSSEEYIIAMGKRDYLLDKMSTMSDDALIIKLCDRLQNISDSYSASESFRSKYFIETKYIITRLKLNRELNGSHRRIVDQIEGTLRTIKHRYQYESKHIKMYENFTSPISINDIVKCIEDGGLIYAKSVKNYPNNNPKTPLTPVSIDEDGLVTVDVDGKNYEVELKYIDKIKYRNERV